MSLLFCIINSWTRWVDVDNELIIIKVLLLIWRDIYLTEIEDQQTENWLIFREKGIKCFCFCEIVLSVFSIWYYLDKIDFILNA